MAGFGSQPPLLSTVMPSAGSYPVPPYILQTHTNQPMASPVRTSPDENEEHRRIRRVKNAKRAQRRRNAENRAHNPMYQRNLNNAFAAAVDREYRTPIGAIAEATLLAQQLPPNLQIQRLQYLTQRALVQLDGQHPVSSIRNLPSRSERHGETALISRTPGGGPGNRRNNSRQRNEGHPSARGNDEEEVQQSTHQPRNQRGARPQGQAPLEASLHDAPTINLRQKINDGRDARSVIEARRRDRADKHFDKSQRNHPGNPRKRKPVQEVATVERNPHGKKSGNNDTRSSSASASASHSMPHPSLK
ncbi:hypothetical protein C2845_PM08G12140 [Panicum miliaceum]|uniref:Uncharacterized protein n=1 Tax=Panicum miliaceum TaxID=4540 RepID=A0A3L6QXM9_PANMI|nr:hypothetical protein C2845_PM08G12140 [Panicum miliaceum]